MTTEEEWLEQECYEYADDEHTLLDIEYEYVEEDYRSLDHVLREYHFPPPEEWEYFSDDWN